jgi:hypothetical protein
MSEPRPHTLFILSGIAIATLISTITGIAIGRAINNNVTSNVTSQNGRSRPSIPQTPQQLSPLPITQEPAQAQPVSPRATLPIESQVQPDFLPQTENCANPDDRDSRGRRCGKRSAYTKGQIIGYDSNR